MSHSDVPPDEMGMDPEATDDALDRMLSGAASPMDQMDDELRDVALFVQELQDAVPSSGLASEDLHVAAMVETAHLLAENGDPVARPVSDATSPVPQVSGLPKQRRKPMKKSIVAKVLAPIAAVLTVFGGMAYAGALPHTVQKAVSHAASTVGINVPGDDDSQGDNDNQGEDTQGDETVVPPTGDQVAGDQGTSDQTSSDDQGDSSDQTSADDQGENDDSQGDNNNQGEDTQGDGTDQTSGDSTQSSDQGDQGGDTQSGDTQSGDTQDGGGDQQGDSQN
jgi:hypothetical protein